MIQLVQVTLQLILFSFLLEMPSEEKGKLFASDAISVRESTVDLQIRVDHKIFVFQKANGNLEKVKVGMHVLPFFQNPKIEGLVSSFKNFTWKRAKDGSIQIRSFYSPEAVSLIWTIFKDGNLKLEALGKDLDQQEVLGLGFDFQEGEIKHAYWKNAVQEPGEASFEAENPKDDVIEVQGFSILNLEFERVQVGVKTETPQSNFRISTYPEEQASNSTSNLNFLFYSLLKPSLSEGPTSPHLKSGNGPQVGNPVREPIVLWFDFH